MSTQPMSVPPRAGLFAQAVAQATGLAVMDIYRLHSSDMGAPGHFTYDAGARGGMFYTLRGLSRLVEIFHAEGMKSAALVLRAELNRLQSPIPASASAAGQNVNGGWAKRWEDAQERGAA